MTWKALSRLLIDKRDDAYLVARRKQLVITYGQFYHDVAAATQHFRSVKKGLLACRDSYNFCVGLFGLLHAGSRIVLPQNNQFVSLETLKGEFDLFIDDTKVENIQGMVEQLVPFDPSLSTIDVFTSGSTGEPQKITKNLIGFEREIEAFEALWGSTVGRGPVYATVSHQHIYGLTFKLLWQLAAGRPFTAETHMLWEDLVDDIEPNALLISSPAHLGRLDGLSPLSEEKKLKAIFSAGAPLTVEAAEKAEKYLGCVPTDIFGSTETGAIATRSPIKDEVWRPLPGVHVRIDDQSQLNVRTPFVGNDWIVTKDIVEATDNGFYFRGRTDTIVKVEGKRVSLVAVEEILTRRPEIGAAAVVLLPGVVERLAAAVVLSIKGQEDLSRLGAFRLSRHLRHLLLATEEAASVPRLWRFVDALPVQAMGKRRKNDLMALFREVS